MWLESEGNDKPVPGEWIVERLAWLRAELQERDPQFRELEPRALLEPGPIYQAVQRGEHEEAIAILCGKYGLDPARIRLEWKVETADEGVAAHVRSEPFGPIEVCVREQYRTNPCGFATVLAHEIGHAYLTDMDIENGGTWEAEATTDLVTFVKGLGKLTVNGVDHLGFGQKAGSRGYGYLNREAVVFAYARIALDCAIPTEQARAGLNPAVLGYLRVLEGEPGPIGRFFQRIASFFSRPAARPTLDETEIAVDADGNLVDARTGRKL
jgi:hypothetical protein